MLPDNKEGTQSLSRDRLEGLAGTSPLVKRRPCDELGEPVTALTLDHMGRQQLGIYAKELQALYLEERNLRQSLEQRMAEIISLNKLFQRHMNENIEVVRAYRQVLEGR